MEQEKKPWKETVHYIKDTTDNGRVSYTGQSVNYGCICSSWESVEDLQRTMKAMIGGWIQHAQETMAQDKPLKIVECTPEEWESRQDNTVYWELDRCLRLLRKPEIQKKWKAIINNKLKQALHADCNELAERYHESVSRAAK